MNIILNNKWNAINKSSSISVYTSIINNLFIAGMELVGPSKRMFVGILVNIFWSLGVMLLGSIAYLIRDWNYLQMAMSFPSLLLLCYWWWVTNYILQLIYFWLRFLTRKWLFFHCFYDIVVVLVFLSPAVIIVNIFSKE